MKWSLILTFLCIYGFFKEFRPLEPFLTPYLLTSTNNFTDMDLYSKIYPIWTYSYLATLIPIFMLSDLLRYNIILLVGGLAYGATWILLIFGSTIRHMQCMQFLYGLATATEVAYFAYGYAVFDPIYYKTTTSYIQSFMEAGRFFAYGLSQILISTKSTTYLRLNYIALGSTSFIIMIVFLLPHIPWKTSYEKVRREIQTAQPIDDHVIEKSIDCPVAGNEIKTYGDYVRFYFTNLRTSFKNAYSTKFMCKWSLWCALSTCGWLQVVNYIQNLWILIQPSQSDVWNGAVEAINTLLAAVVLFLLQYLHIAWNLWGECTLALISIINCIMLIIMSQTTSLILIYILYAIFRILYEIMITVAMYNIAKIMQSDSFGLVFGFNTFIALVMQTLLTIAFADERGFALDVRNQFLVYGIYYGLIFIIFLIMGIRTLVLNDRKPKTSVQNEVNESMNMLNDSTLERNVLALNFKP